MTYLDDSVAQLTVFETSVRYMYLDSRGLVTVGVGNMLPDVASAQALNFFDGTGAPSLIADIATDYQRVKAMAPDMWYSRYQSAGSPELSDATIAALLLETLTDFDNDLSGRFVNYASFPDPAKLGLLDMIYNLGKDGLFQGFPNFMGYVDNTDWANAALECDRGGPSPARNQWTKAQFVKAATLQDPAS